MADWKSSQEFLKEFYASPIVNEDTISAKIKRIFLPKSRKASALKELAGESNIVSYSQFLAKEI